MSAVDELAKYRIPDMSDDDSDSEEQVIVSVTSLTPEMVERLRKVRPKSLNLVCGRASCDEDLHTYRPIGIDLSAVGIVPCTKCGRQLAGHDPKTIRASQDTAILFGLLQSEWIRHFFFHLPISDRIYRYALRQGREGLIATAGHQLRNDRMIGYSPRRDFSQTAMLRGTILHWARHATACCCRRCIAYWHDIPMSATLTEEDIQYLQTLVTRYIDLRLPGLDSVPAHASAHEVEALAWRKAG